MSVTKEVREGLRGLHGNVHFASLIPTPEYSRFASKAAEQVIPLLDDLDAAEAERDRLLAELKLAEYMSRKDSLCEAERLEGTRAALTRALGNTR